MFEQDDATIFLGENKLTLAKSSTEECKQHLSKLVFDRNGNILDSRIKRIFFRGHDLHDENAVHGHMFVGDCLIAAKSKALAKDKAAKDQ